MPAPKSDLVVCIIEGRDFADLDSRKPFHGHTEALSRAQKSLGTDRGSDAFVSMLVDFDADNVAGDEANEVVSTSLENFNDRTPQWNACFSLRDKSAHTPLIFVAADADFATEDDAIGYACTTATTGTRWLDLLGPGGAVRGQLRVQVANVAVDENADAASGRGLGWATVESAVSAPVDGVAAHASVACARGSTPIACQCWSHGVPGCAHASRDDSGRCVAVGGVYYERPALPPCPPDDDDDDDDDLRPHADCAPRGWRPLPRSGVLASARCASTAAFTSMRDVTSEPTLGHAYDAAAARCDGHETLLGCAAAGGDGAQLGVATEYVPTADGRNSTPACVAYTGGSGSPARSVASCAAFTPPPPAAPPVTTIALTRKLNFGYRHLHDHRALLRCPPPFVLVGCSCRADVRDCLGVRYGALHDGTAVCNVSLARPPSRWMAPFDVHVNCVWRGAIARLDPTGGGVGRGASTSCASVADDSIRLWEAASANVTLLQKPWLPRGVGRLVQRTQMAQGVWTEAVGTALVEMSLASFFLGVLMTLLCGCLCRCACAWVGACTQRGRAVAVRDADDEVLIREGVGRSDAAVHRVGELRAL